MAKKLKSLSTNIINNLPSNLKDEEIENKSEEIENCRNYLSQFNDSQKAYEVINSFLMNLQIKIAFILELSTRQGWNGILLLLWDEDDKYLPLTTSVLEIEEERRIAYVITRL